MYSCLTPGGIYTQGENVTLKSFKSQVFFIALIKNNKLLG